MDTSLHRPRSIGDDAGQWNHLLTPVERQLARLLMRLQIGELDVRFPSGARVSFKGAGDAGNDHGRADISLHTLRAVWRAIRGGALGLAESYMDGEWWSDDLVALLSLLHANEPYLGDTPGRRWLNRLVDGFSRWSNRNSLRGSRRNIAYHYDLGNDFYELWLDETMTYSSALFESAGQSLADAQLNKYRQLARAADIRAGDEVLEIGCGWGGFAEIAAQQLGCRVTGITLSREQLALAQARMVRKGLDQRVQLYLMDYRQLSGQFDRIISIEMFEAVGSAYWPAYFAALHGLLKPGGRVGIQVITIDDELFDDYQRGVDFIQKYIFPGGLLPSDRQLRAQFDKAGLACIGRTAFGDDYRRTLALWERTFEAKLSQVRAMGYSDAFIRMWRFYLAYCQAGFAQGTIDVAQYVLSKPPC